MVQEGITEMVLKVFLVLSFDLFETASVCGFDLLSLDC
jgi:hypothetical protein